MYRYAAPTNRIASAARRAAGARGGFGSVARVWAIGSTLIDTTTVKFFHQFMNVPAARGGPC